MKNNLKNVKYSKECRIYRKKQKTLTIVNVHIKQYSIEISLGK